MLICSLGAYGGPEAHMGVFVDQMVTRRRYLTEDELVELMALCSILPGPTSTQTIVSIGYKTGGPLLALLTMLVWALPVLVAMTLLSFLYRGLAAWNVSTELLRFIGPMAVGFIVVAAFRIGRKVVNDRLTALLLLGSALTTYWIRAPWIFPVVLLAGGAVAVVLRREPGMWNRLRPPWRYLAIFAPFALGLLALSVVSSSRLIQLAESFYRILKCHVLVDLKVEEFSHENIGQINTYVSWYRKNMMTDGDNPPVGLLLCTQKDHALVEYALAGMDNQLFVSN